MRTLVCGGRHYSDYEAVHQALVQLPRKPTIIIQGNAPGGDTLAKTWAIKNGIHFASVPALWSVYQRAAGFHRNTAMLLLLPEYCVALPGGNGTQDMVDQCEAAGIPVWRPYGK